MTPHRAVPVALTVAGSDSCGGAGIQADLKAFSALGVYGTCAITAITAQSTTGVTRVQELPPDLVAAQMDAVLEDIGCDAAKTGMLANADIVYAVADRLRAYGVHNLVIDPVMVSKSGHALLAPQACQALARQLFPLARVVTPNLQEAQALVGYPVERLDDMRHAARDIADLGPAAVVVTGGHLDDDPLDLLYLRDPGQEVLLRGERLFSRSTHGTGCTFSAAIAALLAAGRDVVEAVRVAKRFISLAIIYGPPVGQGWGPTDPHAAARLLGERKSPSDRA